MRLTVKQYNEDQAYHECQDDEGRTYRVDLIVDGTLPDDMAQNPEQLVGRTVQVGWLSPFIEIAQEVELEA